MKKLTMGTMVGLTTALICAAMGLAALSATVVTATIYFAAPAMCILTLGAWRRRMRGDRA